MRRDRAWRESARDKLSKLCRSDETLELLARNLESVVGEDPIAAVESWAKAATISQIEALALATVEHRELGPLLLQCWEVARARRDQVRPGAPPARLVSWSFDIPEEEFFFSVGQELQEALAADDLHAIIVHESGHVEREVTSADMVYWWAGGRAGASNEGLRAFLLSLFESENVEVRRAVGWALSWTGAPSLETDIDQRIRSESDAEVKASLLLLAATHVGIWAEDYAECISSKSSVLRAGALVACEMLQPELAFKLATTTTRDPPWLVRLVDDIRTRVAGSAGQVGANE